MKNIDNYISRFYSLMESKMGDVKPLLSESIQGDVPTDFSGSKIQSISIPPADTNFSVGLTFTFKSKDGGNFSVTDNPSDKIRVNMSNACPTQNWKETSKIAGKTKTYGIDVMNRTFKSTNDGSCYVLIQDDRNWQPGQPRVHYRCDNTEMGCVRSNKSEEIK